MSTADELLILLLSGNPTLETLEAARALLKAHKFTAVSAKLFRLANKLRR